MVDRGIAAPGTQQPHISDETEPKQRWYSSFLKETRSKVVAGVAAIIAAGLIANGKDSVEWMGDRIAALRDSIVQPVIVATLEDQLGDPESALSSGIQSAIEARINSNAGSVFAGAFLLSDAKRRHTVPFYLPIEHIVELSLDVRGLKDGEVIQISSENSRDITRVINRDGNFTIDEIRQLPEANGAELEAVRDVLAVSEVQGLSEFYFPIHLDLTYSADNVASGSEDGLKSEVRIEFVGVLSPPIRHVRN